MQFRQARYIITLNSNDKSIGGSFDHVEETKDSPKADLSGSSVGRFLCFMSLLTILGQKKEQSQKFLENGVRIPVTRIWVKGNVVTNVRTADKNHYSAIQLGFGTKKNATKSVIGNTKGASLEQAPNFLKEVRIDVDTDLTAGTVINPSEILAEGDIINVTGVSKGKGYAGVVKRYGFHGGPKTHGQSDRHRAPGSIGQGTTPGRVYRGKRMAGRMGDESVTIRNLVVVGVTEDEILVKGLVPGGINTMVIVKKVGANKKFVPLFKEKTDEIEDSGDSRLPQVSGDAQQSEDERSKDSASLSEIQTPEVKEEPVENPESNFDSPETEQAPVSTESADSPEAEQATASSSESSSETGLTDSQDKKEEIKEDKENAS